MNLIRMGFLYFSLLLVLNTPCLAQNTSRKPCKIEFYLLNRVIPNDDSTKGYAKKFTATLNDLADTAFIKNEDIVNYSITSYKDSTKENGKNSPIRESHKIKLRYPIEEKLQVLGISLCCGRQFALVVNGQICYSGYFWNIISSYGWNWITAFGIGSTIDIWPAIPHDKNKLSNDDPRKNKLLFDCLKATNRLIEN